MDLRKTREQLGRIRVYYLKGDTLRALASAVMALRDLSQMSNLSTEMRSMLREGIGYLARDEELKRHLDRPLAYQPGQNGLCSFSSERLIRKWRLRPEWRAAKRLLPVSRNWIRP